MFKHLLTFSMPLLATGASTGGGANFTGNEFLTWVAILAFVVFLANQMGDFWRKNIKAQPASSDVARDLEHLEKTITTGLDKVETSFETRVEKMEQDNLSKIEKLEAEMDSRFDAAYKSRVGLHKDQDLMRERMARAEVEIENLKQKEALQKIAGK